MNISPQPYVTATWVPELQLKNILVLFSEKLELLWEAAGAGGGGKIYDQGRTVWDGLYSQVCPLRGVYLTLTGISSQPLAEVWLMFIENRKSFLNDFICLIQWCTRAAQWRGGDPGVSSSERTGLYCSLESSLLAPCSDSMAYCSWTEHLTFAEVDSAEKVSLKEYVEFRGEEEEQIFHARANRPSASHSFWRVLSPWVHLLVLKFYIQDHWSYCLCIYRNPYSQRGCQLICLRHAKISEANKMIYGYKKTFDGPVLLLCCSRMALL